MKVNLSDGEWRLMNLLWDSSPRTIMELTAAVREETGWSKHTVITMLSRLEAKDAVRHEEGARAKQYYPVIDQKDAVRAETRSFLEKVYGGSLGLMLNTMVESRALSQEDMAELSAILERAGGDKK
jgi:predicted transcriptional regulator